MKGFKVSDNRKALVQAAAAADFRSLSTKPNVLIRDGIHYGDLLYSALDTRLHAKLGCHLPNTLRRIPADPAALEEKMVDTAIASDMVDMAHRESDTWLVVVGDDDDLVPPTYVAEAARIGSAGKVLMIRTRPDTVFLKLDGLRFRP